MSEYTPTPEDVRRALRRSPLVLLDDEWNRFIAGIQAKALRDAAEEFRESIPKGLDSEFEDGVMAVLDRMYDRANRIEAGE